MHPSTGRSPQCSSWKGRGVSAPVEWALTHKVSSRATNHLSERTLQLGKKGVGDAWLSWMLLKWPGLPEHLESLGNFRSCFWEFAFTSIHADSVFLKNGSWGILDPWLKNSLEQNYQAKEREVKINMDCNQSDAFLYKDTDFTCKREVVDIIYLDFITNCGIVT